jgi:hypothetical protein
VPAIPDRPALGTTRTSMTMPSAVREIICGDSISILLAEPGVPSPHAVRQTSRQNHTRSARSL